MVTLDPRRARELFEWIDINLAPATCDGVLVPAADEYYTTLSLLARTAFAPSDRGAAQARNGGPPDGWFTAFREKSEPITQGAHG